MAILSIQSRVASGYVGNAAATPILQRLGRTVWPVDTVAFSNHPAHGSHSGGARPAAEIAELIAGLDAQGLLSSCDAVLSGYLGTAAVGPVVVDAVERTRTANPDALWCCDPVMGDNGSFYVAEGIPDFFRERALPGASILLPNAFEAAYLSGKSADTPDRAARAAERLLRAGPDVVVVSGVTRGECVGAVVATADGCWRCMAPRIDAPACGAGDAFAALFLGAFLARRDPVRALGQAVSGIHTVLKTTAEARSADLELVAALPDIETPAGFPVERVS